jgi:hypothetical protein
MFCEQFFTPYSFLYKIYYLKPCSTFTVFGLQCRIDEMYTYSIHYRKIAANLCGVLSGFQIFTVSFVSILTS